MPSSCFMVTVRVSCKRVTCCNSITLAVFVYYCFQSERKAKVELESLKVKTQDLDRTERLARVDIEQLTKRVSFRFR